MAKKKDADRRQKLLAERAARFESHAAMVTARTGDSRYPQRALNPDGSYSITLHPAANEALREQHELFREKFGRDPDPGDPVFFDPDSDEPTLLAADFFERLLLETADRMDDRELRAMLRACVEVGFLVTERNRHLFSAHEVEAWGEAVERHLQEDA
ncbi:MAG: hypothetical protein J2P27_06005 [Actinobacteria bacterium]|nr:hypothetical protein [Actinomycetota bacterium]